MRQARSRTSTSARLCVPLLCLGLLGCADRPIGVLVPVAQSVPGASTVHMLVATTRQTASQAGVMFSGERRPDGLAYADIAVSIPPDAVRTIGDVQWPEALPGNPATDFVTLRAAEVDQKQALAQVHGLLAKTPKRRVLVFVHGFNNKFEEAVYRFAQIVHDSDAPAVPVLFTWPSRASILAYGYDRESTNYSRDALETVLQSLAADPQVGEISILAHSMGNWLAIESLRQMAIRHGTIDPKIKTVILAAPDVDVDVFRGQMTAMGPHRPAFTLFVSQDDRALAVSERVWGGTARLGAIDPDGEPIRSELARERITVVDLTKLRTGDDVNHAKFAESPDIVRAIGQRLVAGQTITDSHIGVGDRISQVTVSAASAVGSAAGLVLSAPAAVVDPDSRAHYNDQVQTLGTALGETAHAGTRVLSLTPNAAGP